MYDNKIRLSQDVLEKAEIIAQEWGLKNARAAIEAVFRKYSDSYLQGHALWQPPANMPAVNNMPHASSTEMAHPPSGCEALDELDALLGF